MKNIDSFQIDDFNGDFIIVTKFISKLNEEDLVSYKGVLPAGFGLQEDCIVFRNKDGSWYKGMIPLPSKNCSSLPSVRFLSQAMCQMAFVRLGCGTRRTTELIEISSIFKNAC